MGCSLEVYSDGRDIIRVSARFDMLRLKKKTRACGAQCLVPPPAPFPFVTFSSELLIRRGYTRTLGFFDAILRLVAAPLV